MATSPTSVDALYGIATALTGFTIESESVRDVPQLEKVPDQMNRTAKELLIETRHEATLTLRGASAPTAATFDDYQGSGKKWILDSVEKAGTYNGLQRWNVSMHYTDECNEVTAASSSSSSSNS